MGSYEEPMSSDPIRWSQEHSADFTPSVQLSVRQNPRILAQFFWQFSLAARSSLALKTA
jgi:hypothetical protein